jgi:aspartyl-tRNA(Asn)/glutamyl-tRNA(Gln) amidotransferase subunit C
MYWHFGRFVNRKAGFGEQVRRPRAKQGICYLRRPMADAKITLEQVLHVAKLARLTLSEDEARQMQQQLDAILGYMEGLDELDVSDVPPTFHSIPMDAPLRPDVPDRCSDRSETLAQAPQSEAGGYAVPLVLEVDP